MSTLPEFQSGQKLKASDLNQLVEAINSNTEAVNRPIPAKTGDLVNDANFLTENTLPSLKTINGESIIGSGNLAIIGGDGGYTISRPKDGSYNIIGIAHRGYSSMAPENTLPAFILAKQKGFNFVECDVSFTNDGVAVLLHDDTIDRTSNGSGKVSELTYEELLQYDFGSYKSNTYTGTKIPTFMEFINLCKKIGLHSYIEFKKTSSDSEQIKAQVENIISLVKSAGMSNNVTYISFEYNYLTEIKTQDKTARLGYLVNNCTNTIIEQVLALQTGTNEVILDIRADGCTDGTITLCQTYNIPLEVWTVDVEQQIIDLPAYVSGVTSNYLIAGKVIANSYGIYVNNNSGNSESGGNTGGNTGGESGGDAGGDTDDPTDANYEILKVINGNPVMDYSNSASDPREAICVGWQLNNSYNSGGKTAFAKGNQPTRASYTAFDIITSPTAYYKALVEDENGNTFPCKIGYQWFNKVAYDRLNLDSDGIVTATSPGLNDGGTNILDDGWQDPSLSYRATKTTVNGSPIVGFRITLGRADNVNKAFDTPPYKVTLYKAGK
jgi:glycerophosphoryl diester phosphodiesterase